MAKPKPKTEGPNTVAARRANEAQRQADAQAERQRIMQDTIKAKRATANFLKNKPTDTRGLDRA